MKGGNKKMVDNQEQQELEQQKVDIIVSSLVEKLPSLLTGEFKNGVLSISHKDMHDPETGELLQDKIISFRAGKFVVVPKSETTC